MKSIDNLRIIADFLLMIKERPSTNLFAVTPISVTLDCIHIPKGSEMIYINSRFENMVIRKCIYIYRYIVEIYKQGDRYKY